jgi:transcriptional regulator NrdR family protein
MNCPCCQSFNKSKCKDSRPEPDRIRRRRECIDCGHLWSTLEITVGQYEELLKVHEGHRGEDAEIIVALESASELIKRRYNSEAEA